MKINCATDDAEKESHKLKLELHHRKAEAARKAMDEDSALAGTHEDLLCLCFDLEQMLETRKLPVGEAFHLRQLNTYNFAVVNNATLEGTMFVWNETEGRRGADGVASCLIKYLDSVPASVK